MPIATSFSPPQELGWCRDAQGARLQPQIWSWPSGGNAVGAWQQWAAQTQVWLRDNQLDPREFWVTLPVGAMLGVARRAWLQACGGGWQPRMDTWAGWAQSQGWQWQDQALSAQEQRHFGGALQGLAAHDLLLARAALLRQDWARSWQQREPRAFDHALAMVVDAATTWWLRLRACEPQARAELIGLWRSTAGLGMQDPAAPGQAQFGAREQLLLGWALEWAVASAQAGFASDALFAARPAAWMVLTVGDEALPGSEAAAGLSVLLALQRHGVAVRWVAAMAPGMDDTGVAPAHPGATTCWLHPCSNEVQEAQAAAALALRACQPPSLAEDAAQPATVGPASGDEQDPVAIIALDRRVVRHLRAQLEGRGLRVADETGWRLSTTRAGAALTRLLVAAHPRASSDELLDWLMSGWVRVPAHLAQASATQLGARELLELEVRRLMWVDAWSLDQAKDLREPARQVWAWAQASLTELQGLWRRPTAPLGVWLQALCGALQHCGAWEGLIADAAGQATLAALGWSHQLPQEPGQPPLQDAPQGLGVSGQAWQQLLANSPLDGRAMQRWLQGCLESVNFRPAAPQAEPDVVITTLARACLRAFRIVIIPGAGESQLGGGPAQDGGWLGESMRRSLGLSDASLQRSSQWHAWCSLLTRAQVHVLYSASLGAGQEQAASPWLQRWSGRTGVAFAPAPSPLWRRSLHSRPVVAPAVRLALSQDAGTPLPQRLSATVYEQLRRCPYQFFAYSVLRLREQDELEEGIDASHYGQWLHETLRRFHETPSEAAPPGPASPWAGQAQGGDADLRRWLDAAHVVAAEMGWDRPPKRAHFGLLKATLSTLGQAYLDWQREHHRQGWAVQSCELDIERELGLEPSGSLRLVGTIDRLDKMDSLARPDGAASSEFGCGAHALLDYKTSSAARLKQMCESGLEDTQLLFYAALLAPDTDARAAKHTQEPAAALSAAYVRVDPRGVEVFSHAHLQDGLEPFLQGLRRDWQRMLQGTPLRPLGEGSACEYCHAKGLCRKDHWWPSNSLSPSPPSNVASRDTSEDPA